MSTYVYGLVGHEHPREVESCTGVGASPAPVRALPFGELVAVVGDAPADMRAKRRDLLAHERVLEQLCAQGTTLPMRFGVLAADDEAVVRGLSPGAEEYRGALSELAGLVEVNVKAEHEEDEVLRQILLDNDDLRALHAQMRADGGGSYEERLHFGELISHEVEHRRSADSRWIVEQLAGEVVRSTEGATTANCFVNFSGLVPSDRLAHFESEVEEVGAALDPFVRLRVRGPLPPYSFTEISERIAQPS